MGQHRLPTFSRAIPHFFDGANGHRIGFNFREVRRTTQRLERRLQRVLKAEADTWDKWCTGRIYTPTLEKVLVQTETLQMEQYYQAIERLSLAFWPMMGDS